LVTSTCLVCGAATPAAARFCPACGAARDVAEGGSPRTTGGRADAAPLDREGVTELAPAELPPARVVTPPRPFSRPPSTASLEGGRFAPGAMLGGRYRIVELLGQGGMGEVYRAEDLLLGQRVALKFLPTALADDVERMERLLTEVRLARQVSHPNVCRVYDVGEADGHRFFSMELVEGDDLATLLRQVGRFSDERALAIARQLCAGLAAAHDKGVVHRDLKPANVLVDREGKVHVADFGLALAGAARGAEAIAGSPGYMAPEQLAGREATAKSDLFALGAVLFELFTGRRAYRADSWAELRRLVEESETPRPSAVITDIDPAVERVILRCLEREPELRPASALAVAAALPGGDPLAAALAAGETPSPEMVAAAGGSGALEPARAAALVGAAVLLVVVAAAATALTHVRRFVPADRPPAYLDQRARDLLDELGHRSPVVDVAAGWSRAPIAAFASDVAPDDLRRGLASGRLPVLRRFYRQSPRDLRPQVGFSIVGRFEPAPSVPGEAQVELDTRGRLVGLVIVEPERVEPAAEAPPPEPQWGALLAAAGLPANAFRAVAPEWSPAVPTWDRRAAWVGAPPELPGVEVRVEAAAHRGKPVSFRLIWPWFLGRAERPAAGATERLAETLNALLWLLLLTGTVLAWRNVRLGRGDRRGAWRIAVFFFVAHTVVWLGQANHAHTVAGEWFILQRDLGYNLFYAGLLWVGYMAVEPYVRRQWPETLIAWSRLLAGRFADPRLGRDLLIGMVLGAASSLIEWLIYAVPFWRSRRLLLPRTGFRDGFAFDLADNVVHAVLDSLLVLFILLAFLLVLRRRWLAVTAVVVVFTLLIHGQIGGGDWLALAPTALFCALVAIGLTRFGLVALVVGSIVERVLSETPWTLEAGAWYAWQAWVAAGLLAALLAYGWRTATAGRAPALRPLAG
jgi:serine/threonine-protein kinase